MALMVEAAELAEIFQWMTPEQSQAARGDLVLQEQVAHEVADVLLYLVQITSLPHPDARFVVVSNDKGYAPMLEHAAELGFSARQVGFGKSGAVVEAASASSAAKKAAPAEKVAAKKVPTKPAAKKAVAKLPSSPVAKAQAKKVPAAKKAAATKTTASPAAAPTTASVASTSSAATAFNVSSVIDLKKAISHVVASLRKTTSKPTKRAKLVAAIKSLLGQSADEQAVHSVLAQLLASGKVVIDSNGSVQYAFQSA